MADKHELTGKELIAVTLSRAASDPALKAKLLADGNAALTALGIMVPPNVVFRFIEDTPTVKHLVIPCDVVADGELSDDDLGKVAGGAGMQMQLSKQLGRSSF